MARRQNGASTALRKYYGTIVFTKQIHCNICFGQDSKATESKEDRASLKGVWVSPGWSRAVPSPRNYR